MGIVPKFHLYFYACIQLRAYINAIPKKVVHTNAMKKTVILVMSLYDLLLQDNPPALQAILSGEVVITSTKESHRQEQRERALALLHLMIEDAHMGKRQFLSGMSFFFL